MRVYKCPFGTSAPLSVGTGFDLIAVTGADDKQCCFLRLNCFNMAFLSNMNEQIMWTSVLHGAASLGSGGTTGVSSPCKPNDVAASFTYNVFTDGVSSAASSIIQSDIGWNMRLPLDWIFIPEENGGFPDTQNYIVWRMNTTPPTSLIVGGCATVGESG